MPDRYGADDGAPVADFDSRRRAREAQRAIDRAAQQRQRLAESRTVHAPLSRDQSAAARNHQRAVTSRAEKRRNEIRIANCRLCDPDGYTPGRMICDHVDHRPAAAKGMAELRRVMGWDGPKRAGAP